MLDNPSDKKGKRYIDQARMQPLQLGVLAGLTPPDVEVVLYDDRFEDIPYDDNTDLVAITVEAFTARRSYEISEEYKRRNVPVIMGGVHPTLMPEEVRHYSDSIFIGDAEKIWHEVIKDARERKLKPCYRSKPGVPQPGTFTRRDIFEGKGYLPLSLLQFSRGCTYACNYCTVSVYFNQCCHQRPIREVIEEIERQDKKFLFFVDDNIVADFEAAKKLFKELIPLNIRWVSQASINMTDDRELMDLMEKSGCIGNVIGFEAITEEALKDLNKSSNLTGFNAYKKQIKILKDYNLQTWAAFVLGHDQETADSIEETFEFALDNKFCFAAFNVLIPYPKTPLYEKLEREERLLYEKRWWLHPGYRFNHAPFIPKNMSVEELTENCLKIRKKWNNIPTIFKRLFNLKTNMNTLQRMSIFIKYNALFRKETFKKQDMKLGLKDYHY